MTTEGLHPRLDVLAEHFRCPNCRSHVTYEASVLQCSGCQVSYESWHGVPLMLDAKGRSARDRELSSRTGTRMVEEYRAGKGESSPLERALAWLRPPDLLYHADPDLRRPRTQRLYDHRGAGTLVLNVGGGPRRYRPSEITVNLDTFPNVDVVGDAHNLPFLDHTFDSAICIAVLEHVHHPETVVAEIIRVLKPGGLLYAEVPFVFFFHGYPNDFRRYTREGMRQLFAELEGVEIAPISGPMSAVLQSTNMLLQLFLPDRLPLVRKVFNGAFRLGTFGLKYLDIPLMKREEAHTLAAGFYVIGRKPLRHVEASE